MVYDAATSGADVAAVHLIVFQVNGIENQLQQWNVCILIGFMHFMWQKWNVNEVI